ncbi:hypothetical protein B0O99DRAFT_637281 [Bisporella sp. PMI_857]|nr:hypothetical protein B0O99DRAFT_637281 [Bisporella sp. PMI_857]
MLFRSLLIDKRIPSRFDSFEPMLSLMWWRQLKEPLTTLHLTTKAAGTQGLPSLIYESLYPFVGFNSSHGLSFHQ